MLRAIFFSTGLFVALVGGSFQLVDQMVMTFKTDEPRTERNEEFRGMFISQGVNDQKIFDPPAWAAWFLMSLGSVTMLYAVALPRRN